MSKKIDKKTAPLHYMTFIFEKLKMRRTVSFDSPTSILKLAMDNQLPLEHSCGGMASCGTCRVFVDSCSEPLPPRNELESDMAESRNFSEEERLSCQTLAIHNLVVRVP